MTGKASRILFQRSGEMISASMGGRDHSPCPALLQGRAASSAPLPAHWCLMPGAGIWPCVGVPGGFDVASFLDEFAGLAGQKGFTRRILCETAAGPLLAWERLDGEPPAYVSAGMHGDEPAGPLAALELLRSGALDEGSWLLCPALNPADFSGRPARPSLPPHELRSGHGDNSRWEFRR